MRKPLALLLTLLLAAGILAGCAPASGTPSTGAGTASASTTSSTPPAGGKTNAPTEIVVWYLPFYDGIDDDIRGPVADKLKADYPWITLKPEMLAWDTGPEKAMVAMATGATPDAYADAYARVSPGIYSDLTVELNDVLAELGDSMAKGFDIYGVKDGRNHYVALLTNNGYDFTMNMDLVEKYNLKQYLPEDKVHWSHEQFLTFCREARKAGKPDGVYATALYAASRSSDASYYSLILSAGSTILNDAHTAVQLDKEKAAAALRVLETLVKEDLVPAGAATSKDEEVDPFFYDQKVVFGFSNAGAQTCARVKSQAEAGENEFFKSEMYQLPTLDGKADPLVATFGNSGFVVFKNAGDAAKIDAAKKFIVTLHGCTDILAEGARKAGTPFTNVNANPDYGDPVLNEQAVRAAEWNSKYSTALFGILEPWWADFRETFYPQLQGLYTGAKTPEQVLDAWEAAGNEVISKALAG